MFDNRNESLLRLLFEIQFLLPGILSQFFLFIREEVEQRPFIFNGITGVFFDHIESFLYTERGFDCKAVHIFFIGDQIFFDNRIDIIG